MKINMIRILLLLFVFSCNEKKPKLQFANSKISLDTVYSNTQKPGKVIVRNLGNENLVISDYTCSCECTVPDLSKGTILKPNDSLSFNIVVKGYADEIGKWKIVQCTFKSNSDSIFSTIHIKYYTK